MTAEQAFAIQEKPDLSFTKIPHEPGMTYEFVLKVRMTPFLDNVLKGKHKAPKKKISPDFGPRGSKFTRTLFWPTGHVFFGLKVNKDGKEICARDVGFSTDDSEAALKRPKFKDPLLTYGVVFDQEKWKPTYHFDHSFPLSREQFDRVTDYVNKTAENPPNYQLLAVGGFNCARFTRRCAKVAGIKNSSLSSVFNLPETSFLYIQMMHAQRKLNKAARKIEAVFSPSKEAPVPATSKESKKTNAALLHQHKTKGRGK